MSTYLKSLGHFGLQRSVRWMNVLPSESFSVEIQFINIVIV